MLSAISSAAWWIESCQMGVARRRLDIAVTEELADHRQGLAERQRAGRKGVAEVVQANVIESGPGPDCPPDMVEAVAAIASVAVLARKHPGAVRPSRQGFEKTDGCRRELHRAGSGLGIGEMELAGGEIDVRPVEGEGLALAAAVQHQQADRGDDDQPKATRRCIQRLHSG